MSAIYLSQVLTSYRASGLSGHSPYFDLTYRKADGSFGQKTGVRRQAGQQPTSKKDLTSIQQENRQAGKLHLVEASGRQFELHIPLLVTFNGQRIDHRF